MSAKIITRCTFCSALSFKINNILRNRPNPHLFLTLLVLDLSGLLSQDIALEDCQSESTGHLARLVDPTSLQGSQ